VKGHGVSGGMGACQDGAAGVGGVGSSAGFRGSSM
jgi:hypothetical protein